MVAAIIVMWEEIHRMNLKQFEHALFSIPTKSLFEAVGCTLASYLILSFYDKLALIQTHHGNISFHRAAFVSFCSYVLSHNLGFAALTGAAVRYRLYRGWGVTPFDITQIIVFCSVTYILGVGALVGGLFIFSPSSVPGLDHYAPFWAIRCVGILFWGGVIAYCGLSARFKTFKLGKWHVSLPSLHVAVMQVIVAVLEIIATSSIMYVLIPPECGLHLTSFLTLYITSYLAGLISSVPGGLGVFDGTMLLVLKPWLKPPMILGIVLVFRIFYYIIPFFIAGTLFVIHEILTRLHQKKES